MTEKFNGDDDLINQKTRRTKEYQSRRASKKYEKEADPLLQGLGFYIFLTFLFITAYFIFSRYYFV